MSTVSERWRIAVHEAGHGLLATHVRNEVERVSIKPGERYDGSAHHKSYEGDTEYTMPQRHILVSLAGKMAERELVGENDPDRCVTDMWQAWAGAVGPTVMGDPVKEPVAKRLFLLGATKDHPDWPNRAEAEKSLRDMETECGRILALKRIELERLATHLSTHEECQGSDIPSICDGTWRPPQTENQASEEQQ